MIQHIRFTDLPQKQRARVGEAAIRDLRRAMLMPLPDEHRAELEAKIESVNAWMQAPQTAPLAPSRQKPVHHAIVLSEDLSIDTSIR